MLTIVLSIGTVSATSYYFNSTTGSDAANCLSRSTACKTISKLNSIVLAAGDNVIANPNEVYRINEFEDERIIINESGSSAVGSINFYNFTIKGSLNVSNTANWSQATQINITGDLATTFYVNTQYYNLTMQEGTITYFYSVLQPYFSWARSVASVNFTTGAMLNGSTYLMGGNVVATTCTAMNISDSLGIGIRANCSNSNAENVWTFYDSFITVNSTSKNGHRYLWQHAFYYHTDQDKYRIFSNGTQNNSGTASYTDWDSITGTASYSLKNTSLSNLTYVVDWDETKTTDFDWSSNQTTSTAAIRIARGSELSAGTYLYQEIKIMPMNMTLEYPSRMTAPIDNFIANNLYGDNLTAGMSIWRMNKATTYDVGNFVVNDTVIGGSNLDKKSTYSLLDAQGEFFYDSATDYTYFYSSINPATYYGNLEMSLGSATYDELVKIQANYIKLEGFDLSNAGNCLINIFYSKNVTISESRLRNSGGIYETGTLRYGGCMSTQCRAQNMIFSNNNFSGCYDNAISMEAGSYCSPDTNQSQVQVFGNLMIDSGVGFQIINSNYTAGIHHNYYVHHNTIAFSGSGWTNQRPNKGIGILYATSPDDTNNINYYDNIIYYPDYEWINLGWDSLTRYQGDEYPGFNYNLYYESNHSTDPNYVIYWNNTHYHDLATFTAAQGQELDGYEGNPLFLSLDSSNESYLVPAYNSPACSMSSTGSYVGALPCSSSESVDITAPSVVLNSPVVNANFTNVSIVVFNCTVSDDVKVQNVSLLINSLINQTNISGTNNTAYWFAVSFPYGNNITMNWTCMSWDNNSNDGMADMRNLSLTYINSTDTISPEVVPNHPVDENFTNVTSVIFNCSATDNFAIKNVSLLINEIINQTNTSGVNNTNYLWSVSFPYGNNVTMNWSCIAWDNDSHSNENVAINFSLTYINNSDIVSPVVGLVSPVNNGVFNDVESLLFNCTAADNFAIKNVSLLINEIINQTNTSGVNNTGYLFNVSFPDVVGVYNWSCLSWDDSGNVGITNNWFFNNSYSNSTYVSLRFINISMNDSCLGNISFGSNISSPLSICINNMSFDVHCVNYTGGDVGVNNITYFNYSFVYGNSYRLHYVWDLIRYVSMNVSSINGFYDGGFNVSPTMNTRCMDASVYGTCSGTYEIIYYDVTSGCNLYGLGYTYNLKGYFGTSCTSPANPCYVDRYLLAAPGQPGTAIPYRIYDGQTNVGVVASGNCREIKSYYTDWCYADNTHFVMDSCTPGVDEYVSYPLCEHINNSDSYTDSFVFGGSSDTVLVHSNSSVFSDAVFSIRLTPEVPLIVGIVSPVVGSNVSGVLMINYSVSGSYYSYSNISLYNIDGSFNRTIIGNNSLYTNYSWNYFSNNLSIGEYILMVDIYNTTGGIAASSNVSFFIVADALLNVSVYSNYSLVSNYTIVFVPGTTYVVNADSYSFGIVRGVFYNVSLYGVGFNNQFVTVNYSNYTNYLLFNITALPNSIYITFKDYDTLALLPGVNIGLDLISSVYANNYSTNDSYLVISGLPVSNYTLRYYADSYDVRNYFVNVSNQSTQNLSLYMISNVVSNNVTITVIDQNANPVSGAVVKALKYDLSTNSYLLQEMLVTDVSGRVFMGLSMFDEYYKFMVDYGGVLKIITVPAYITSTSLTIQILLGSFVGEDYNNYAGVFSDVSFNTLTNNFRFDYDDTGSVVDSACLEVYKMSSLGEVWFNSSCNYGSSGTILVGVDVVNGTTYLGKAYYWDDGDKFFLDSESYSFPLSQFVFGMIFGLLLQLLITASCVFVVVWSIPLAALLTPLSLVVGRLLHLNFFGWDSIVALFVVGIIVAYITRKN